MIKISSIGTEINGIGADDWFYLKAKNNSSELMNINGAVTPKSFTLEDLPDGQKILIQTVNFVIGADALLDLNKFGNTTLANGIEFSFGSGSGIVKNNADVLLISTSSNTYSAGVGSNTISVLTGRLDFTEAFGNGSPIILDKEGFYINIQDDLTSLPYFEISLHGILIK